jgi:uncharacterized membrane-anchored protein
MVRGVRFVPAAALCAALLGLSGAPASSSIARAETAFPPATAPADTTAAERDEAMGATPPGLPPGSELRLGPASVDLPHDLTLGVPEGMLFGNHPFADALLRKNGSLHNENVLGIVLPQDERAQWWVILRHTDDGHVDDTEALDAKEILEALREGLPDLNEERKGLGMPPLTIEGWLEAPSYDRANHLMLWALDVASKDGHSANVNTRVLGRTGMLSLNLVTSPESLSGDKRYARELLAGTGFKPGHRYEDFEPKTDKLAEYGLTGLIAAGAGMGAVKLVKLGLLAKFGKVLFTLLLAAKKFVVVAALGAFAFLKRLFGFGPKEVPPESAAEAAPALTANAEETVAPTPETATPALAEGAQERSVASPAGPSEDADGRG